MPPVATGTSVPSPIKSNQTRMSNGTSQVDEAVAAATLPPLSERSQARLEALYATDFEDGD